MTRVPRRLLISTFIVVSLITQVLQNLAVGYIAPQLTTAHPLATAAHAVDQIRWGFETYGFYTSTNTFWRMFSPVHKYDWWWRVVATEPDGRERELIAPSASASDPSSLHIGFRDAKMLLNLWTRPPMQAAYIDHRCRDETRAGRKPASIRLELQWRELLPPDQAAARGTHRGAMVQSHLIAHRGCA